MSGQQLGKVFARTVGQFCQLGPAAEAVREDDIALPGRARTAGSSCASATEPDPKGVQIGRSG